MTIKIGSLFSGIGGFELGLERAIPNSETVWQCEQDKFCQKILTKHWPNAIIYDDVRTINNEVEPIDILCGGFPCQDISIAGLKRGLNGNKSSLWWEMHRIIGILEPRIIIMENVSAITYRGGKDVIGSLTQIGYDCQWSTISAAQCGAPHRRTRWFCIAYPNTQNAQKSSSHAWSMETAYRTQCGIREMGGVHNARMYWSTTKNPTAVHRMVDGVPNRVDRIKALGNAIVPQCSEWIGQQLVHSGLIDDLMGV